MTDSFLNEMPKARINLKFDLYTGDAGKKTKHPVILLVAGYFCHGQETAPLSERKKVNLNKNNSDDEISKHSSKVSFTVRNTHTGDVSEDNIRLTFQSMKDFSPEKVSRQIPQLKAMHSMRNLFRDLKVKLLEASLSSWVEAIELEHDVRLHFWQARLHAPRLREGADYYLSVRSPLPAAVPRQRKVGSPDHVRSIVNSSPVGVPLVRLRHVSADIPLRMENQYFSLDVSYPLAIYMLQSGICIFYVLGMLGEPEPELFAVLRT